MRPPCSWRYSPPRATSGEDSRRASPAATAGRPQTGHSVIVDHRRTTRQRALAAHALGNAATLSTNLRVVEQDGRAFAVAGRDVVGGPRRTHPVAVGQMHAFAGPKHQDLAVGVALADGRGVSHRSPPPPAASPGGPPA